MTNEELVALIQSGINTIENTGLLYTQNIGFIRLVVKKYSYACQVNNRHKYVPIIEFDELMHEAYFGLVEAVNNYDPKRGVLFNTYSAHWINQVVKRYLDNCGRVVRVRSICRRKYINTIRLPPSIFTTMAGSRRYGNMLHICIRRKRI